MQEQKKENGEPERLDIFVAKTFPGISRAWAKVLIKQKYVRLNSKVAKSCHSVCVGDIVTVEEVSREEKKPELLPLEIIFEDEHLIVIDKSKGMAVHPGEKNFAGTLVGEMKKRGHMLADGKVGVVHRLDKDTSGLIVLAKTEDALEKLAADMAKGRVERRYLALVHGQMPQRCGKVDKNLKISDFDRRKMEVTRHNEGKRAVTRFKVLEDFPQYQLVEFELETGRTHQIRAHSGWLGCPLVGDSKYGAPENAWGIKGQMLQSNFLSFTHPVTGEKMEFSLSPSAEFKRVLASFKKDKKAETGLFVGKFLPPHLGHRWAILEAAKNCAQLFVLVCDAPAVNKKLCEQAHIPYMSLKQKTEWWKQELKAISNITVLSLDESGIPLFPDGWEVWAQAVKAVVGKPIDLIFGSEVQYAEGYSKWFPESQYIIQDSERIHVSIASTIIREGLEKYIDFIIPAARPFFEKLLKEKK